MILLAALAVLVPDMVELPAGEYMAGAQEYEWEAWGQDNRFRRYYDSQVPRHRVIVQRFAMGRYEVTVGQYRQFAKDTGRRHDDGCELFKNNTVIMDYTRSWGDPGYWYSDDYPVTCVNWSDADAYARWLSKKTSRKFRLPSEAEWEYAARAGSDTMHTWGNGFDGTSACLFANVSRRTFGCEDGYPEAAPVGSFPPNKWGLHDMEGNAGEWTGTCWHRYTEPIPTTCSGYVHRMMFWGTSWWDSRLANRSGSHQGTRYNFRGFRVAEDL